MSFLYKIKIDKGMLVISLVYLAVFLYMLPLRSQTYQDDWAYIQSVKNFLDTGVLKVSEWSSASLIFPIYWGALFSKIFGPSIQSLHLSTITLLYFGLISFYSLLKKFNISPSKATIFTIFLFANPWVLHFNYTFLTDIPYISLLIISLYFYTVGFQKNKSRYFFLGSIFASCSFLTRQIGLAIPLSVLIILFYKSISLKKINVQQLVCALLPFFVIVAIYLYWLNLPGNLTTTQYQLSAFFKKQVLPYLLPTQPMYLHSTFSYYATAIQRIIFYLHHSIGFLFPLVLIFTYKFKFLQTILKKNLKVILIIASIYLFFLASEILLHFDRRYFNIDIPSLVIRTNNISPIDINIIWKYFVVFSIPIWITVIAITIKSSFVTVFKKRDKQKRAIFFISLLIFSIFLAFYQLTTLSLIFKDDIPQNASYFGIVALSRFLKDAMLNQKGLLVLSEEIIIYIPLIAIFILVVKIATTYTLRIQNTKFKPEFALLFFTFTVQLVILIFFMYFHWAQYAISLIPFFIIVFALFTKKWKINPLLAISVCAILLLFSANSTKNRYQNQGIHWEIANNLVQQGIAPVDISSSDESWLPWWYFEKTFNELVTTKFGNNKYQVPPGQWATWRSIKTTTHFTYQIIKVPLGYESKEKTQLVLDTGPIYDSLLTKTRYIVVRESSNKLND